MLPLSMGKSDSAEVPCDVVDMETIHVLLGRPWQYDVTAIHHGKDNTYS